MVGAEMSPSVDAAEPNSSLMDPRVMDPAGELLNLSGTPDEDIEHTLAVLEALRRWHTAERRMNEASQRYMKLGETDMRALRYMIAAQRGGFIATPGVLAQHLGISTASVTKLLDRLEAGGHIVRSRHPEDRRSTALQVTPDTHKAARESVGRHHAERFRVASQLSAAEQRTVIRFLDALSATEGLTDR